MGKKGTSSSSSKPVAAPAPAPEPPKRKPRGHRQKGAGTVIVAPPPVVTSDGVVLAPHMRLPSVLVREYCQREKRPLPMFFDSPKPNRQTCVLRDPKNSKDDLRFLPVQSFESPTQAREYAALLALQHLQPSLPLERKLPEPYATAWRDVTAKEKAPAAEKKAREPKEGPKDKKDAPPSAPSDEKRAAPAAAVAPARSAPSAVLGLKAASSFASRAAKDQAHRERAVLSARKRAYFDAVRLANKPESLFMSSRLRAAIESALGIRRGEEGGPRDDPARFGEISTVAALSAQLAAPPAGSVAALLSRHVSADQTVQAAAAVHRELTEKRSFKGCAVAHALAVLLLDVCMDGSAELSQALARELERSLACLDDEAAEADGSLCAASVMERKAAVARGLLRDCSLEFLCLHMEEDALPEAFEGHNNKVPPSLDIIAPSQNQESSEETSEKKEDPTMSVAKLISMYYGWEEAAVAESVTAVAACLAEDRYPTLSAMEAGRGAAYLAAALIRSSGGAEGYECSLAEPAGEDVPFPLLLPTLLSLRPDIAASLAAEDFIEAVRASSGQFEAEDIGYLVQSELETAVDSYPGFEMHACGGAVCGYQAIDSVPAALAVVQAGRDWLRCRMPLAAGRATAGVRLEVFIPPKDFFRCINVAGDVDALYPVTCMLIPVLCGGSETRGDSMTSLRDVSVELWAGVTGMLGACSLDQVRSDATSLLQTRIEENRAANSAAHYGGTGDIESVVTTAESVSPDDRRSDKRGDFKLDKMVLKSHPFWARGHGNKPPITCAVIPNEGTRSLLPAWTARNAFLALATTETAMIITGETGCGKTTQIPQYLLEHNHALNTDVKVLVCQPRRLAAVGVANRVAEERNSRIGNEVGYMVRGDCKAGPDTRLLFCTYGVLLRRLQNDEDLASIDYIVLDEVHERGLESDFSLGLLMNVLKRRNDPAIRARRQLKTGYKLPPLRLILMSATIETDKFIAYLNKHALPSGAGSASAPLHHIPGYTFPVKEYYRGDFERYVRSSEESFRYGGWAKAGAIDYDLLVRLILHLVSTEEPSDTSEGARSVFPPNEPATGCILVFMPGVSEISRLLRLFAEASEGRRLQKVVASALHGSLSPSDQSRVFRPAPKGIIKLVVATNVAETSVTIPDVTVVIDTCKVKNMMYDEERQMPALTLAFASKDSLRQRRGRAGRVQAGKCFRMIHQRVYEKLEDHGVPDILRTPIERLVLQVLSMATNPVESGCSAVSVVQDTLSLCPDPPNAAQVEQAVSRLQSLQAVVSRQPVAQPAAEPAMGVGQMLTPLGRHIANFPCPPVVGKLLIFGAILGCVAPISAVAACMTLGRNPFESDVEGKGSSKTKFIQQRKCGNIGKIGNSDHLLLAEVVRQFRAADRKRQFCTANGLSFERLGDICKTQEDLVADLVHAEFLDSVASGLCEVASSKAFSFSFNGNSNISRVVAAALCAGLYPHICQVLQPPKRFVDTIGGSLEKNVGSNELKFYIKLMGSTELELRERLSAMVVAAEQSSDDSVVADESNVKDLQRVFLHPANNAVCTAVNGCAPAFSSRYLLYSSCHITSKAFINDVTEIRPYSLLLFGNNLDVNYVNGVVEIDSWIRYFAPGRVVALVLALRRALDDLLDEKVEDPATDISASGAVRALVQLLSA